MLSAVLEVALGLSFLYFVLSLMCSALNEVIAGVAALRARTLVKGVRHLLDSGLEADRFYAHPLVESLYRPRRKPSYIPADVFALAVVDLYVPEVLREEPELIFAAGTTDRLRRTLELLWLEAEGDVVAFRKNVEKWFNDTMDRVSGWYRRQTQIFLFVFALLITIGLNVNTVGIAQRLWTDAPLRAAVAGSAATVSPPPTGPTPVPATDALQRLNDDYRRLQASRLPLGWAADNRPSRLVGGRRRLGPDHPGHLAGRPLLVRRPDPRRQAARGRAEARPLVLRSVRGGLAARPGADPVAHRRRAWFAG